MRFGNGGRHIEVTAGIVRKQYDSKWGLAKRQSGGMQSLICEVNELRRSSAGNFSDFHRMGAVRALLNRHRARACMSTAARQAHHQPFVAPLRHEWFVVRPPPATGCRRALLHDIQVAAAARKRRALIGQQTRYGTLWRIAELDRWELRDLGSK